jgi:nitrogen regulatory protein PII
MTANKLTLTYMKLVLITAIAEFEKDVKNMLKEAKVKSYSYKEVKGFRDASEENIESNWFGSEMNETDSVVFYAFILQQNLDTLFDEVTQFNKNQETISKVHLAVLSVEKYN